MSSPKRQKLSACTKKEPVSSESSVDELISLLAEQNKERTTKVYSLTSPQGDFLNGKFVETLFSICQEFQLPREVYYLSAELLECFMQNHIIEMRNYVTVHSQPTNRKEDWMKVIRKITDQVVLRMMSCIQLASKFVSNYENLNRRKVTAQLRKYGYKYNDESIVKSELRVLKGVGFKVMRTTPLVYVTALIDKLYFYLELKVDKDKYLTYSYDILDIVLVDKRQLYESFGRELSNSQLDSQSEKIAMHAIENDYMFMASSILATTSFLIDQSLTDRVIETLNEITAIPVKHIVDMTSILLKPFAASSSASKLASSPSANNRLR